MQRCSFIAWLVTSAALAATVAGCPGGDTDTGQGGDSANCQAGARPFSAVPADWTGPALLALNANPSGLPSCPTTGALSLYGGLDADPASCPCSCQPDATHGCQASLDSWSDGGCSTGSTLLAKVQPGCTELSAAGSLSFTTEPAAADACTANSPPPQLPGPRWGQYAVVCPLSAAAEQPGCATPAAGFADQLCIFRRGDAGCPPGYPFDQRLYASVDDTRDCTGDCSCSAEGMSCGGSVTAHSEAACGQPGTAVTFGPDECTTLASAQSFAYQPVLLGTCTPNTRTPTGGVSPTDLYTVCCDR